MLLSALARPRHLFAYEQPTMFTRAAGDITADDFAASLAESAIPAVGT